MEPADAAGFAALEEAVKGKPPEVAEYLAALKSRSSAPSIAHRFARLSALYSPATATADEKEFRALAKTRNDLLHSRISELPDVPREAHPSFRASSLATRYLGLVVAGFAAQSPTRSGPTTDTPSSPNGSGDA